MSRAYIFDFFGVISSEVAPRWIEARLPNEDARDLHDRLIVPADLGTKPDTLLFDELGAMAGMSGHEVLEEWNSLATPDHQVVELIRELKQESKIGLCSNAWASFLRPLLRQYDLESLFDSVVISSELGYVKPNPPMFLKSLEELGVEPQNSTFVDDQLKNVTAAEAIGMTGIQFIGIEDLRARLKRVP